MIVKICEEVGVYVIICERAHIKCKFRREYKCHRKRERKRKCIHIFRTEGEKM